MFWLRNKNINFRYALLTKVLVRPGTINMYIVHPGIIKNMYIVYLPYLVPRRYFFCGSFVFFMSSVCHAFASVNCYFVVT